MPRDCIGKDNVWFVLAIRTGGSCIPRIYDEPEGKEDELTTKELTTKSPKGGGCANIITICSIPATAAEPAELDKEEMPE